MKTDQLERNPGVEFQQELFCDIKINRSAVEQRCSEYGKRRSIKKENQDKFDLQYEKKSRASIDVEVQIRDINDEVTSIGTFTWFVSKL